MTADTTTAIKKALEELREKIGHAYDSGYNRLGQLSDWCADLDAMRPTLESLQRENEELRQDLKDATEIIEAQNQDHASNNIRFAENAHRAEAAEAEVKRMRNKVAARALNDAQLADEIEAIDEACKGGFGEGGGSPGEWWYERSDELEHERKRRELESQLHQHNSQAALSSTGDTHGN